MLQGQGQWKENIKVIEVKGQGHFSILLVKKSTTSTINDIFVLKMRSCFKKYSKAIPYPSNKYNIFP